MILCIPIDADQALDSPVCSHFGSAPAFLFVTVENGACRAVVNGNQHHAHGMCMPLQALQGETFDALVVGGIGMGALGKLDAAGIRVYMSAHATAGEVLSAFQAGTLAPMLPGQACSGHYAHGHSHS
ncbi:MAG: NifB/NifX family molybdenum-iron cluster-binding protein [Candidatus Delongbacteria bacterium]